MYRRLLLSNLLWIIILFANLSSVLAAGEEVPILCYHDVGKLTNDYTVTATTLKSHFDYLKSNGYTPISLDQYIRACKNGSQLPQKPVLLTFDDGYLSFYKEVYPLLKQYNYPAVLAVVTSWMDYQPPDVGQVVNWQQMREMEASGLVTIASHSHQSHSSTVLNPQGDTGKMLETLQYTSNQYESIDLYRQRVQADLEQAQALFKKELGHKVSAMVWPYGAYTAFAVEIGYNEGFEVFMGLNGGFNTLDNQSLQHAQRGIVSHNPQIPGFSQFLKSGGLDNKPINAAQLDIDLIYDPTSTSQTEHNLDLAIDRFNAAGINTVFLQAFSDSGGNGNIESVYFYTKAAPVKANIFSHIAARLRAQGFRVYAWMPTLACQWLLKDRPEDTVIAYAEKGKGWYTRATPFSPVVAQRLKTLFTDLAAYSYIDGILFQDDLYLNDYEDFSPAAKEAFQTATGQELTPVILQDSTIRRQWTQIKTTALTDLTQTLIAVMRQYRPYLATARNLYPSLITQPDSQEWLAQNFNQYLNTYDFTIIMAYPYMEKQYARPLAWLGELADASLKNKANAAKIIFKLQTYDWNKKRWLSTKEFKQQVFTLKSKGAINFAYYPENVFSE